MINQTEQPMNQMSSEQPVQKLTIEQEQEQKLRSKYPNPQKSGGSAFIQKMLHKGNKKYFDSGDYNMARSKKQGLLNKGGVLPSSVNPSTVNNNASTPISQVRTEGITSSLNCTSDQAMSISDLNSPFTNVSYVSGEVAGTQTPESSNSNNSMNSTSSELPKPCTPNQKTTINQFEANVNNSNYLNTSNANSTSPLSSSLSSNNLQNTNTNNYYLNPMTLQTSQSSQSISLLSSSISSDKIAQIQINQQQVLDSEEIGHGIPTPECLPQSRKHSIVQSKLATPRLSSS